MKTKAYTDLQQSKKLAEILPIDSADMYYHYNTSVVKNYYDDVPRWVQLNNHFVYFDDDIPCWSIASLFEELPDEITTDDGTDYNLGFYKDGLQYYVSYRDFNFEQKGIETDCYNGFVDACYKMILKLHEQKLI